LKSEAFFFFLFSHYSVEVEECTVALPVGGAFGVMFYYKTYVQEIILHELFDVKHYLMEIKNK
jgi:hypothetical protein